MADIEGTDDLPRWFYALSELSMDPHKGPDEQYRAGARDMWALVCQQHKGAVEALRLIAEAESYDLALDPTWPKRMAGAWLRTFDHAGER
jgi:hypothetical protein